MAQTIGIIGLGYVGLPLAVEFGKITRTIGFDLSAEKITQYQNFIDPTGEVTEAELRAAKQLQVTTDPAALRDADVVIIAVPTPVTEARLPDFGPLISASRLLGPHLKLGAIVVYESTVYPGATEEVCIPELELASGKKWQREFFVGYSPERINPGDKEHTLTKIVKVVSADTPGYGSLDVRERGAGRRRLALWVREFGRDLGRVGRTQDAWRDTDPPPAPEPGLSASGRRRN